MSDREQSGMADGAEGAERVLSRRIGRLVGPSLVVLGATEAMHMDMYAAQIAPVVYLNGMVLFVAGLAIVNAHNRWRRNWTLLVTLTGWGALLLGLYRVIDPGGQQAGDDLATYMLLAILFFVGLILTAMAYLPAAWRVRR